MDDTIYRQAAIKLAIDLDYESRGILKESKCREIENRYNMIPPAQPDIFDALTEEEKQQNRWYAEGFGDAIRELSAQPEIIRCEDCKHNPNKEWFGCPMAHLTEEQRPEDAWCWKGERDEAET